MTEEDPNKFAVCVHEAGHAVMFAHYGRRVKRIKVEERTDRRFYAYCDPHNPHNIAFTSPDTKPADDFREACLQGAGCAAQISFAAAGAGIPTKEMDDVRKIAHGIAWKTDRDYIAVLADIVAHMHDTLEQHADVVREVAAMAYRGGTVYAKTLDPILARVGRAA